MHRQQQHIPSAQRKDPGVPLPRTAQATAETVAQRTSERKSGRFCTKLCAVQVRRLILRRYDAAASVDSFIFRASSAVLALGSKASPFIPSKA